MAIITFLGSIQQPRGIKAALEFLLGGAQEQQSQQKLG